MAINGVMPRTAVFLLGVLSILAVGDASAQQSSSFKMKRIAVSTLADRLDSPSFRNTVSVSAVVGSAGVCPSGPATSTGFWSFLGVVSVPVVLHIDKNGVQPRDVELTWTGQADEFDVYRSGFPNGLVSPTNLFLTTGSCSATDTMAKVSEILFYSVTPTSF